MRVFAVFPLTLVAIITSANAQSLLVVKNNGALEATANGGYPVVRAGFATPGDGGYAVYNYSGSACTLNSGAGDNGSQVPAKGTGCWLLDPAPQTSVRVFGVGTGASGSDDSAYWQNAVAWAGTARSETLVDDVPDSVIASSTRIVIPANVTIRSNASFEGADGSDGTGSTPINIPNISFTNSAGGFTLGQNNTLSGLNIFSTTADHCLKVTGKFDYEHVRFYCTNSASLVTKMVTPGLSLVDSVPSQYFPLPTGLTNGKYTKVPLTNGGGATATVYVVNGSIASPDGTTPAVQLDGASTSSLAAPEVIFGFAANTVGNSSAIAQAGYLITANTGRSRVRDSLFFCSTNTALEIDGALDYTNITGDEFYCSPGTSTSTALRTGRAEGLKIADDGFFGYGNSIISNGPGFAGGDFTSIVNDGFDQTTTALNFTTAQSQLIFAASIARCNGTCLVINNAATHYTQSGDEILAYSSTGTLIDYAAQFSITGGGYQGSTTNSSPRIIVSPDNALASPSAQTGYIGGVSFDANAPGLYYGINAGQITLGPNSWPNAASTTATAASTTTSISVASATGIAVGQPINGTGVPSGTTVSAISGTTITASQAVNIASGAPLAFGYAYFNKVGSNLYGLPAHTGIAFVTTDASGNGLIACGLGTTPLSPSVSLIDNSNYSAVIQAVTPFGITLQVLSRTGTSAAPASTYAIQYGC